MYKEVVVALLLIGHATFGPAHAANEPKQRCDVDKAKADLSSSSPEVLQALAPPFESARCSSILTVLRQLKNRKVPAGRKLGPEDKPSSAANEMQLAQARADGAIQSAVAEELVGTTDAVRRLVLEAAVLVDNGQADASNALLDRLAVMGAR